MSEKELKQLEKALSLVNDEVFNSVMQSYIDSYGLEMDVTRENCVEFLEVVYNIQSAEEQIDFEYFYDILTTFIKNALDEMLYPEEE